MTRDDPHWGRNRSAPIPVVGRDDVNLEQRSFLVRESKGKTRIVPFGADLARELVRYREVKSHVAKADSSFFVRPDGRSCTTRWVSDTLRQLLRRLGLKPLHGRVGLRPFDFRHAFAVYASDDLRPSPGLDRSGVPCEGRLRFARYDADDDEVSQRAAIYARVSTAGAQSPQMQLEVLREYAARRGLGVVAELVDHGLSGAREHRPALDRLMTAARQRQIDVVLVYRFDRFARSVRHLVSALDEFKALDVEFVSYSESVDTSTPLGRALFSIVAALADYAERAVMRTGLVEVLLMTGSDGNHRMLGSHNHESVREAMSASGALNLPRRRPGGRTASTASSFSVGSTRK